MNLSNITSMLVMVNTLCGLYKNNTLLGFSDKLEVGMKRAITIILFSSFWLASCGESTSVDSGAAAALDLSRAQSIALGLDPYITDTDGDGISDADEVGADPENPLDSDGDGIIDALEAGSVATDSTQSQLTLNVSEASANALALSELSGLALKVAVEGGSIDPVGLLTSESSLAGDEADPRDAEYDYPYGLFNLKVSLREGATSSSVILEYPEAHTIADDVVLRVRKTDGNWVSFTPVAQANGRLDIPFFNAAGLSARNANLQIADGGGL